MTTATMTSRERIRAMFEHREADHVPITDSPWAATVERWHREGLPEDVSFTEYFNLDQVGRIGADNSPRFPVIVVAEDEETITKTTNWGATQKQFKHRGCVPEYIDFTVTDEDEWIKAKARMNPDRDRINWEALKTNYPRWKKNGAWIQAQFWFGFDVTHSHFVGTETLLMAMITDPEWVVDMYNHFLDVDIALFEMVWDAGYHFDSIFWPDDMGYKLAQFFSLDMYRDLLKPVHARAAQWARDKGCKVHLHSCGDIRPFVPDLIDIGIDMLNPLEVKAGVDPCALKKEFGDQLAFHGGLNAVLYEDMDALFAEMEKVIPVMKEGGGYWISTDHSVPDSVSLEKFGEFVEHARTLSSY